MSFLVKATSSSGKKIAFNTLILYLKMLCTIVFSFFTIRFLLEALGVDSYGVYTLITGVVSLLLFLNSAMTVSTQRYLSYYQGKNDLVMQKKVFNHSVILHLIVGVIVAMSLVLSMPYLFSNILNIKYEMIDSAKNLYLLTVFSVSFSILSVPFRAVLNAHENIIIDSIVILIQSFLKFSVAVLILTFESNYKIEYLGASLVFSNMFACIFYVFYCRKNYVECKFDLMRPERKTLVELGGFAFWNLYSNLCYVLNTHGINVLLNIFFGTLINAAYGVAFQVNAQIKNLSQSLLRAISPQIMKSEGMNNRERTLEMSMNATKYGFFLVALGTIPCIFLMEELLSLWLKTVPDSAVVFCQLFLLSTLINQLTVGISPAVQAIGRIKLFQSLIGSVALLALPLAYFLLYKGCSSLAVFYVIIGIEIITGIVKVFLFRLLCGYSVRSYIYNGVLRSLLPAIILTLFAYSINISLDSNFKIPIFFFVVTTTYLFVFYTLGLNSKEKQAVNKLVSKYLNVKSN